MQSEQFTNLIINKQICIRIMENTYSNGNDYNQIKKESKKDRIKAKSLDLVLSSTSHGLPNIFRTQKKPIKIMWLILFSLFSSIGMYMVYKTISNYLKYEVVTKIDVIHEIPAEFPAITIINLRNPKSKVSLSKIMIGCQFNSEPCSEKDFEMNVDKLGYVSYRFKKKLSYMVGAYYGLSVLINLKDSSKNTGILKGLRLIVHNHTSHSGYHGGYSQEGYNIAAGFQTDLVISRIFTQKLGEPFNRCLKNLDSLEMFDSEIYRFILNSTKFKYSQNDCLSFCIGNKFNAILNKSNLIENYVDVWYSLSSEMKEKVLGFYYEVIKGNIQKYCASDCPLECDSVKYHVSSSFTQISNETFYEFIEKLMASNSFSDDHIIIQMLPDNLENLVYFNAFYADLEYTYINQLPKMDFFDLISNIGGNLGLFIGISFLSFAEIIEFIIEVVYILVDSKRAILV